MIIEISQRFGLKKLPTVRLDEESDKQASLNIKRSGGFHFSHICKTYFMYYTAHGSSFFNTKKLPKERPLNYENIDLVWMKNGKIKKIQRENKEMFKKQSDAVSYGPLNGRVYGTHWWRIQKRSIFWIRTVQWEL